MAIDTGRLALPDPEALSRALNQLVDQSGKSYQQTKQEELQEEILRNLDALGSLRVKDDTLTFEGDKFVLPEQMRGKVGDAIKYLRDWEKSQEQKYSFNRKFNYRPWDGAAAFERAMYKAFGSTGVGKTVYTMFGEDPPSFVSIEDGVGHTRQVPWGRVAFTPLNAEFDLGGTMDEEYGVLFTLSVSAPRKHRQRIEAFFELVDRELLTGSLYKGKAINGATQPGFINTATVDPAKVIYSDDLMTQLDANLWSLISHTDLMRQMKLPLKRHVLLSGKWGTGKTLAGLLTAQEAERHGWTYIQVRSGQDDLYDALKPAQLYAPAVVLFEDIDAVQAESTEEISELLDRLDNMANKGNEVIAVFTTNHVDKLHKGIMRPGRLDAVIPFGVLDRRGYERLVKAVVPESMLGDVNYDAVYEAMADFVPAFAREAVDRALRYAIARTGALPDEITTEDLVAAAHGLQEQKVLMDEARESGNPWTLDRAFNAAIDARLEAHSVEHWDIVPKDE